MGGQIQVNGGSWFELNRGAAETGAYTGDRTISVGGYFSGYADVTLRQAQPWPMAVIAIIPKWDSYGQE
jgi:hypothetical protein